MNTTGVVFTLEAMVVLVCKVWAMVRMKWLHAITLRQLSMQRVISLLKFHDVIFHLRYDSFVRVGFYR